MVQAENIWFFVKKLMSFIKLHSTLLTYIFFSIVPLITVVTLYYNVLPEYLSSIVFQLFPSVPSIALWTIETILRSSTVLEMRF